MGLIQNETKERIEIDEAILDSIFGDYDDDEEEEAEEQQEEKAATEPGATGSGASDASTEQQQEGQGEVMTEADSSASAEPGKPVDEPEGG